MCGRVVDVTENALPGESREQRVNRELTELLNELRVALPGVQVLFAFLLTVPFTQRFATVTKFDRDVYFVTLAAAAISSALLIAPSSQHRLLFRRHDKEALLRRANKYAVGGLVTLAVALCAAVLLVADVLFSHLTAIVMTAVLGAVLGWLWVAVPLLKRAGDEIDLGN